MLRGLGLNLGDHVLSGKELSKVRMVMGITIAITRGTWVGETWDVAQDIIRTH